MLPKSLDGDSALARLQANVPLMVKALLSKSVHLPGLMSSLSPDKLWDTLTHAQYSFITQFESILLRVYLVYLHLYILTIVIVGGD